MKSCQPFQDLFWFKDYLPLIRINTRLCSKYNNYSLSHLLRAEAIHRIHHTHYYIGQLLFVLPLLQLLILRAYPIPIISFVFNRLMNLESLFLKIYLNLGSHLFPLAKLDFFCLLKCLVLIYGRLSSCSNDFHLLKYEICNSELSKVQLL